MKNSVFTKIALMECENSNMADIIEGPAEILDCIKQYLGKFYQYADKTWFGDYADYDKTEHLVAFLNEEAANGAVKVRIIKRQAENIGQYKTIII